MYQLANPTIPEDAINRYPKVIYRKQIICILYDHYSKGIPRNIRSSYYALLNQPQLLAKMNMTQLKLYNKTIFYYPHTHYMCEALGIDASKFKKR